MPRRSCDAIDRIIARNIRRYRLMRGLSQQKLAAAIGVTFQQVQKYESGTNRVSASRLMLIGLALRVPLADFIRAEVNPPSPGHDMPCQIRLLESESGASLGGLPVTLELSRRAAMQGAGTAAGAVALPSLGIAPTTSLLPDIETRLGPEVMANTRIDCAEIMRVASPPHIGADGRFILSETFRDGLTRFLIGEDVVLVRRDEEADCPTLFDAYMQWRNSSDWHVFTTLDSLLWRVVRIAFDQGRFRHCAPFYGELRDNPNARAVLLTLYGQTPRYDLAEATFREHWIY